MPDTAPRHPGPTSADATNYAPYAILAVTALVVAILFAVLLLVRSFMAYHSGEPFIQPLMLVFPVAAVVMAYAARRQIQNSEGTRAGLPLVNAAWWIAVIGGFGYASYLVAYQLGVRQDAANTFRNWSDNLNKLDLTNPKDPAFFAVFDGQLEPEQQGRIKFGQADVLYKQRRMQVVGVRQSMMLRLANRNRDALTFDIGGLDNWEQDKSGQKGHLAVKVHCPEGEFTFNMPMQARQVGGQWKWQVVVTQSGNMTGARVTRYGQLILDMERAGMTLANDDFLQTIQVEVANSILIREFGQPRRSFGVVRGAIETRMALSGGVSCFPPEPKDYEKQLHAFFVPLDAADPQQEAEMRRQFVTAWKYGRITQSGRMIPQSPDTQPITVILPDAIEMRVPCELQTTTAMAPGTAARGVVVLRCDDPAFIAKANELRAAAKNEAVTDFDPTGAPPGSIPWRVVRLESDMKRVAVERGPAGEPMPGGGPPEF